MQVTCARITLNVPDGTQMAAYTARPEGAGPYRGLLVLQEAFGVNHYIRDVAERFAIQGYVAVAPELFHRTAPGFEGSYDDFGVAMPHVRATTVEGMTADLHAAYHWLHKEPGVDGDRIASVGFCMGGRASFLADAVLPLQAAISFYGGGIAPGLLDRAPHLRGPLLMFWGGEDEHIPVAQRRAVADALDQHSKPFTYVEFSEAGHGFFCNERPSFEPRAAAQAWALTLAFLDAHLGHGLAGEQDSPLVASFPHFP